MKRRFGYARLACLALLIAFAGLRILDPAPLQELRVRTFDTFQVIDPGICLSGAHRVLTLDAMPSVVREAIEEDHLNITRRS